MEYDSITMDYYVDIVSWYFVIDIDRSRKYLNPAKPVLLLLYIYNFLTDMSRGLCISEFEIFLEQLFRNKFNHNFCRKNFCQAQTKFGIVKLAQKW